MSRKVLSLASAILLTAGLMSAEAVEGNDGGIPITKGAHAGLQEIQNRASGVAEDASSVEETSPVLQDSFLDQMRNDIDYMQRQLIVLREEESSLTATQRDAMAKEAPLLKDAETNVKLAIEYLNANEDHVTRDRKYHTYVKSVEEDCKEAADLLKPALNEGGQVTTMHVLKRALLLGFGSQPTP